MCTLRDNCVKISAEEFQKLGDLHGDAQAALTLAQDNQTRTPVVNQRCEDAFTALEEYMRELKMRYFHTPPLSNEQMVALGFTVRDKIVSHYGRPTATLVTRTFLNGAYEQLRAVIEAQSGNLDEGENQGNYYLCWTVVPAGSPAPTDPNVFPHHLITRRKNETLKFPAGSSGSDAYICGRIEKGDLVGDWGPIVKVRVP